MRNDRRLPCAAASDVRHRSERAAHRAGQLAHDRPAGSDDLDGVDSVPTRGRCRHGGRPRRRRVQPSWVPRARPPPRTEHLVTPSLMSARMQTESASVAVSGEVEGTANFEVGDTYTQQSHLAQGGQPSAVASAKHLLSSMDTFQNVSLMGWGTQDPEPVPGELRLGFSGQPDRGHGGHRALEQTNDHAVQRARGG